MRRVWGFGSVLALALGAFASIASCSGKEAPPQGELVITITTDMSLPKDVDKIGVEVDVYGDRQFFNEYPVGAGHLLVPATLGLLAGSDPSKRVTIRVWAMQGGNIRMLREVVTPVPSDRIAALPIPVQWLCDGMAVKQADGGVESACPTGQTCVAGECVTSDVDSTKLLDYSDKNVFGGGSGGGNGKCHDTVPCMAGSLVVVPDANCTIPTPTGGLGINIGLRPNGPDGICDDAKTNCFVPLDRNDVSGWMEAAGRIQLPKGVCRALEDGRIKSVEVSTKCATKTEANPTCGPWSSVSGTASEVDGGSVGQDVFYKAYCEYFARCWTPFLKSYFGTTEDCISTLAATPDDWGMDYQACAEALNAASCFDLSYLGNSWPAACQGGDPDGSPCATGGDCTSGRCVVPPGQPDGTCGVCTAPLPTGAPCDYYMEDCGSNATCVYADASYVCAPITVVGEGAMCNYDTQVCDFGFDCAGEYGTETCAAWGSEGAACGYSGMFDYPSCDLLQDLECDEGIEGAGVCVRIGWVPVGEPCGSEPGRVLYCQGGYCSMESGTCQAYRKQGEPCDPAADSLWLGDQGCGGLTNCVDGTCEYVSSDGLSCTQPTEPVDGGVHGEDSGTGLPDASVSQDASGIPDAGASFDGSADGIVETNCSNFMDDDLDGKVDCDDEDCIDDPACAPF